MSRYRLILENQVDYIIQRFDPLKYGGEGGWEYFESHINPVNAINSLYILRSSVKIKEYCRQDRGELERITVIIDG